MMSRYTDPQYLKTDQYRDDTNLNARLEIHRRFSTNPYGWFPWIFDTLEALPSPAHILSPFFSQIEIKQYDDGLRGAHAPTQTVFALLFA
jgi:hypothetical protein